MYIVNNLKTKILIKANILILERIIIDFITQSIKIDSYRNIIILIDSRARSKSIKRTIKLLSRITLLSRTIV